VAGAVVAVGAMAVVFSHARMARAHRQVGALTWWVVVGGVVALVGLTLLVAPGAWLGVYRFLTGRYSGEE
jgi:hypothetical protein